MTLKGGSVRRWLENLLERPNVRWRCSVQQDSVRAVGQSGAEGTEKEGNWPVQLHLLGLVGCCFRQGDLSPVPVSAFACQLALRALVRPEARQHLLLQVY